MSLTRKPQSKAQKTVSDKVKLAVIFKFGCVVFWQTGQTLEDKIISYLAPHQISEFENEEILINNYCLVKVPMSQKQEIKFDNLFLHSHNTYEKIMISYAFAQDLFLERMTYSLEFVIHHSRDLAEHISHDKSIQLDSRQVIKNLGRLFLMRDSFALSRGILDCPAYSYYKSFLNSYTMISK